MVLKELVLTSIEDFATYTVDDKVLTREMYLKNDQREIKHFYVDIVDGEAKIIVTLEEE